MKLSIVIPAYNERDRIPRMLDAYIAHFLPIYGSDVELLVIVNGTTDGTEDVVQTFINQYPQIKMVVIPAKIGKGGAIIRGFKEASGDLIGFVDADGSTPPDAFQDLADRIGDHDCIIASRWKKGANILTRQHPVRLITSRTFNLIIRLLFWIRIKDTQCGAKLMTHDTTKLITPQITSMYWAFDVDMLYHVRRAKKSMIEIPTTWRNMDGSKIRVMKSSYEMLIAVIRLRIYYSPLRPIVKWLDRRVGRPLLMKSIHLGEVIAHPHKHPAPKPTAPDDHPA